MSLSAFNMPVGYIVQRLLGIPGFMLFLCFRGFCEAWTAMKLGDNTAYMNGYLTMNPKKHINPIGFIFLILFGFGFSNPVPTNSRNYKNIKKDNAIQILSAPLSGVVVTTVGTGGVLYNAFLCILAQTASVSIYLAIFFLLPLPGFDGYRLIANFLPYKFYSALYKIEKYNMYIFIIFILLLDFVPGLSYIISAPANAVLFGSNWILSKILALFV